MKAWIGAVALAGTLASGQVMADGNQLLRSCKAMLAAADNPRISTGVSELELGQCIGLTEGARNTMLVLNPSLSPDMQTCFPETGTQNGQGIRIVIQYLEAHPQLLNEDASLLAVLAYKTAYPCK
ncbi:Rap1a/Tai family immunity protein [Pseudomonas sp. Irchel s3a18]|uniref:Rap1a/Tai family immunity protein n=1 Tax=Pseudomonas sp. Irchel s3a18 TaxID=2009053 RepID=UPI000BA41601|nr:Rap1a/Tai family immunity protein [Pseudomonas sp. Irchel s3a18]